MGYLQELLGKNEEIVFLTRQHWYVLLRTGVINFLIALIVGALALIANLLLPLVGLPVVGLVVLVLWLLPAAWFIRDWLVWLNEEYLVTNRRVIRVSGVLNKSVIDSSLEKVNDVKMEQTFIGRIFGFGDVEILTASEIGVNLFHNIQNPLKFKTEMLNQKEQLGFGEEMRPPMDLTHDIPALIAELDKLRKQGVITEEEFQKKKADLLAKM
jgi:hypothetical protein